MAKSELTAGNGTGSRRSPLNNLSSLFLSVLSQKVTRVWSPVTWDGEMTVFVL